MDLERLLVEQPNRQDALFAVVAVAPVVAVAGFARVAVFAGVAVVVVAVVAADLDFRPRLALGVSSLK